MRTHPEPVAATCPTLAVFHSLGKQSHSKLFSGWKSRDGVPKIVDDYMAGKILVDEFITANMTLEQINDAFELMHHPVGRKYVVVQTIFHRAKFCWCWGSVTYRFCPRETSYGRWGVGGGVGACDVSR